MVVAGPTRHTGHLDPGMMGVQPLCLHQGEDSLKLNGLQEEELEADIGTRTK
jgi:hypothetical protein